MSAFDEFNKALKFAMKTTENSRREKEYHLQRRHRPQVEINWRLQYQIERIRLRVFKLHSRMLFKEVERLIDEALEKEIIKQFSSMTRVKDVI